LTFKGKLKDYYATNRGYDKFELINTPSGSLFQCLKEGNTAFLDAMKKEVQRVILFKSGSGWINDSSVNELMVNYPNE